MGMIAVGTTGLSGIDPLEILTSGWLPENAATPFFELQWKWLPHF